MKRARFDGLVLFVFGSVMFVMLGSIYERISPESMADFRSVYYGARCLLRHSDPYQTSDLIHTFQADHKEYVSAPEPIRRVVMFCVNLPTVLAFVIPFALLPWGPAHLIWMLLTATSLILASYLMWTLGARDAPVISGALIGLFLFGSEMLLEVGNPAGIEVSLCVIAVWCFVRDRFIPMGVLCLALSVAAKPHVAGLVWLYFLLAGGLYRKRAWQTLAVTAVVSLAAAIWVSHVAPHWITELQANLRTASTHGNVDDPGPAGVNSQFHGAIEISLQTVVSVFRDDPRFYNLLSYLLCAPILLVWALTTLRRRFSEERAWLALAAIAALSMLPIYHRLHDTSLLLLAFPAFAMLWAKGGPTSWLAVVFTGAGTVLTSDFPVQQLAIHSAHLRESTPGLPGELLTVVLTRPVPLVLLVMGIFYLWVYVRRSSAPVAVNAELIDGSMSRVNHENHPPKERRSITVIFPAYNEAANIERAIEQSMEAMSPRFDTFELLVINDGSQDNTGSIAERLAETYPEITVLHNERNMGLGETLYRGFQCAKGELVIQNAMDYPLDLRDLDKLLPVLDQADVVVAVRKAYAGYTPYRKLTSKVNRALLRLLFEPKLRDYNYTQLFKRKVLDAARPTSRSTVFIAPEILIRAHELGFRIKEVEVDFHPRIAGEATSGKPRVILRSLRDMFTFWIERLLAGRHSLQPWSASRGYKIKRLIASLNREP